MNRTPQRLRAIGAVCVITLLGAACGGDDDGSGGGASAAADSPIGKALTAELMSEDDSVVQDEEEARCWSGKIVDGIGEDRLGELGVTAQNVGELEDIGFTEGEVGTIVDSMFDCTDVKESFAKSFEEDFGAEGAACVADKLDPDFVRELMVSSFTGNEPEPGGDFLQAFLDIAAECDLALG